MGRFGVCCNEALGKIKLKYQAPTMLAPFRQTHSQDRSIRLAAQMFGSEVNFLLALEILDRDTV